MGTAKRARQKAGTQARRAEQKAATERARRRRGIIRIGVIAVAVVGIFLAITLSRGGDDAEEASPPPAPVGAEVVADDPAEPGSETPDDEMTGDEPGDEPADEPDGDPAADNTGGDGDGDGGDTPTTTDGGTDAADGDDTDTTTGDTGDTGDSDDTTDSDDRTTAPEAEPAPAGGPDYAPYAADDYGSEACAPEGGVGEPVLNFAGAPMLCIDTTAPHTAVFDTSRGVVRVALDVTNTPGTVNSFVNLARFGYYDDTTIHRSDPSIGILQGGSPHTNSAADPGPGYTLWDEGADFTYRPGQLVMARRGDPNSAGAQYFFTVTADAGLLDGQGTYVVFGEVLEGLDVLIDILASHVADPASRLGGAPDPPVVVNSVTIES